MSVSSREFAYDWISTVGAELAREAFGGLKGLFADKSCSHNVCV